MNLSFLFHRSTRNPKPDLLEKNINELEKGNGIVEKLDAHCGFLC